MGITIEISSPRDDEVIQCLELIKLSVKKLASSYYSTAQIEGWLSQYPSPEVFCNMEK